MQALFRLIFLIYLFLFSMVAMAAGTNSPVRTDNSYEDFFNTTPAERQQRDQSAAQKLKPALNPIIRDRQFYVGVLSYSTYFDVDLRRVGWIADVLVEKQGTGVSATRGSDDGLLVELGFFINDEVSLAVQHGDIGGYRVQFHGMPDAIIDGEVEFDILVLMLNYHKPVHRIVELSGELGLQTWYSNYRWDDHVLNSSDPFGSDQQSGMGLLVGGGAMVALNPMFVASANARGSYIENRLVYSFSLGVSMNFQ